MRRFALLVLSVSLATGAHGQSVYDIMSSVLRAAKGRGVVPQPVQKNVTDLKGFPGLKSREGALPPPIRGGEQENSLQVVRTETFDRSGDEVSLTGGVELIYHGYHIFADKASGNLASQIFTFTGKVRMIGESAVINGDSLLVEFKNRFYRAVNYDADIKPGISRGLLLDDVYLKSKESEGTRNDVSLLDSSATTCSYKEPHYEILAERSTIRPRRRAIFHDVDLILLGHKVLHLPFLSVPLNEPNYNYIPEFGRNSIEGYFVKSRYGVPLKDDVNNLDVRADYFSKLGQALGGDYRYGLRDQNSLGVYGLSGGPRSFELTSHHLQDLGKINVSLDNSYQSHNYLTDPNSISLSSRALLTYFARGATTRLTYNRVGSESEGFNSQNQSIGLNDDRSLSRKLRSTLTFNYASYGTSFGDSSISRKQADVNFDLKDDIAKATAEFQYQRSIPIGETSNFYNASDRTPILTLRSDAMRLFGRQMQSVLPFTTELSTGQFTDPIRQGYIERTNFDLNVNKPDSGQRRSSLGFNGHFRQGFYSDDTAQFVVGLGTQYSYRLGKDTAFHFNYNYMRPQGFTPLAIDNTGRTDVATADLSFRPLRTVLLGAQTGYDFLQAKTGFTPWQSLGVRGEYQPLKNLSIRTLSTYDTFQRGWSNMRADIGFQKGPAFLALGFRYDAVRETLGGANAYVTALRWGRLSADARIEYNGYLKQFSAQQYGFVYDLHCAEAILQVMDTGYGFNPGRQVIFFIRLKAVPFNSLFGTGNRGQPIGTGTGRDF